MSLAVWLPLNGDLHNQGLSNIIVTNNGATINNSGKIGKCYSFNGSSNYLRFQYPASNLQGQFSFSCWLKLNNRTLHTLISGRKDVGYGFSVLVLSTGRIRFDNGTDNTVSQTTFNTVLPLNTWQHIAIIQTSTLRQLYINGILKESIAAVPVTSGNTAQYMMIGACSFNDTAPPTGNFLAGYLNDIRIYNHALSLKEVEEIAKGLVLHYPLNNNGLGNTNLALNTFYEMRPYTISSYYIRTDNTSTDFFNLSVGDTYTCRAKITAGEKNTCLRIQFWTDGNIRTSIFGNWIAAGTTGYSTITSTLTAEQRSYSQMEICLSSGVNTSTSGEYGELKLEKGSIATPWCPNNINTNIIYDTSGYCNNGIVVGDIATITPSPRYNCCIKHLDSCADYIYREYLSFLGDSGFTFSCWINPTSYSRTTNNVTAVEKQFILSQGRDTRTSGTNNTRGASLIIDNGKPQFLCGNGSLYSNTTIPIGEWAHVVGVWTGTQKKIYVNGILKNSANDTGIDWIEAQNSLVIGKMAYYKKSTSSFHPFVGKISDVRIYATALTDNQIKELYNTSMQIDSSGNVFARELVEL